MKNEPFEFDDVMYEETGAEQTVADSEGHGCTAMSMVPMPAEFAEPVLEVIAAVAERYGVESALQTALDKLRFDRLAAECGALAPAHYWQ